MFPYPQHRQAQDTTVETMRRRTNARIITVLLIGGILILIAILLSVASCREELRLEEEQKVLQKSRDSLEQHLIIMPPMPTQTSDVEMTDTTPWTTPFIF